MLHHESPGVDRRAVAAIPAGRWPTECPFETGDGLRDLAALLVFVEIGVIDPAEPVAADVVSRGDHRLGREGVALDGECACEDGEGKLPRSELAVDPPEPDPAAELEQALGGEVTALHRDAGVGESILRVAVSVLDRRLAALLVVENEVQREASPTWPARVGRVRPVADEVSGWLPGHGDTSTATGATSTNSSSVTPSLHISTANDPGESSTVKP